MKKHAFVLLCLLLCLLCMTGAASAEDGSCSHANAVNNGISYVDDAWQHVIDCPDCGLTTHPVEAKYVSVGEDGHDVNCPECGMTWFEGHYLNCGTPGEVGTCVLCDAEEVNIAAHVHMGYAADMEDYVPNNADCHYVYCNQCGDLLREDVHVGGCSDPASCILCSGSEVNASRVEHTGLNNEGFSYYNNVWWHFVGCADCGMINHPVEPEYVSNDAFGHNVSCPECGLIWPEGHIRDCGDPDEVGTCVFCGEENVSRTADFHPLTVELSEDEASCVWECTCGAYHEEGSHLNWCNNPDSCARCGRYSGDCIDFVVWHYQERVEHDQNYCWSLCDACNQEVWFYPHKSDCTTPEDARNQCDRCLAPLEEGINLIEVEHSALSFEEDYDEDGNYWHRVSCSDCGLGEGIDAHQPDYIYTQIPGREGEHLATCTICGETRTEGHWGQCGGDDTCIRCGAENVEICAHDNHPDDTDAWEYVDNELHRRYCSVCGDSWGMDFHRANCGEDDFCYQCSTPNVTVSGHDNHPEGAETYVNEDEECHRAYCRICGDDLGVRLHVQGCSGAVECFYCGAEDVTPDHIDHFAELINFDKNCCYYGCACGAIYYDVWHGVYCNSEDQNTCADCGKNTAGNGIIISDIWHDTEPGYDETHCWTECKACGYRPYYAEHYTGCSDDDDTRCDNCGRSEEDGITLVWRHTALDHDDREEDGTAMHRQVCWDCDYQGEDHETNLDLAFYSIEDDVIYHWVYCSGCEFDWQENHYAICGEDNCAACDAENVSIAYHIDHPDNSAHYAYEDADSHKKYCGICGDDWGCEEHVADCSYFDSDSMTGTCFYCGAENVNVIDVKHDTQYVGFDVERCYYDCACGEDAYNWQHVVYCDEDPNTCHGCGKNTEEDGIVISIIWHRDHTDYNEYECWNTCDNCGDLYRGQHYFNCSNEAQMNCDFCNASSEEVTISVLQHVDVNFNDNGEGWHDPYCNYCGERLSGGSHEFNLYYQYGGYDFCRVYCDTCGYLADREHQGQCGEADEHTTCLLCGAEDIRVSSHDNHFGPEMVRSVDEDYHEFYCGTCGESHYTAVHKAPVGSDETFGTCAVCGAEDVNLHGPVTEEEYIEDGIRVSITYHEDDSKHIDYYDAETNVYYGWEDYENWQDEQPAEWDRRSNYQYDELNDCYSYDFDTSWDIGTRTRRISSERLIHDTGYDRNGSFFYEYRLDESEGLLHCGYYETAERQRPTRILVCTEDWEENLEDKYYEYDTREIPGSMYVTTLAFGEEVAQEFYTRADDEKPSDATYFDNIEYKDEVWPFGTVNVHRDFTTNTGDYGIMYFQIVNGEWVFRYEDRTLGDGSGQIITAWNPSAELYIRTRNENNLPMHEDHLNTDWEIVSIKDWMYFDTIAPMAIDREWRDNGNTAYEKVYPNADDDSIFEERTYVDETGYNWRVFNIRGEVHELGQSVLHLPEGLRTVESEAFVGVSARIVELHEGVTSIASNAFPSGTVLLVPNETIAKLAQDAGYVWFFN